MVKQLDLQNVKNSNLQGIMTLTLDRIIRHTVVHHLPTSIYNSTCQISFRSDKKLLVDRWIGIHNCDGRTLDQLYLGQRTQSSRPKNVYKQKASYRWQIEARLQRSRSWLVQGTPGKQQTVSGRRQRQNSSTTELLVEPPVTASPTL